MKKANFKIGSRDYSLLVIHTELDTVYTLSYVDSDGKKHAISFSDLCDYTEFICMLVKNQYIYVEK